MIRRRIAAYTMAMIAGIASGYFIMEKTELIRGSLLMIAVCIAAFIVSEQNKGIRASNTASEHRRTAAVTIQASGAGLGADVSAHEFRVLISCVLAGFLIFTGSFIRYETGMNAADVLLHRDHFETNISEAGRLEGEILSVVHSDDTYRITVTDSVLYIYRDASVDEAADKAEHVATDEASHGADDKAADRAADESARGAVDKASDIADRSIAGEGMIAVRPRFKILIRYRGDVLPEDMIPGSRMICEGVVREPEPADNPGCFDYKLYLRSIGVGCMFTAGNSVTAEETKGIGAAFRRGLYLHREKFLEMFSEDVRGFIRGVIFGDKTEIDDETRKEFDMNSTGHILAVSALHVGFLYSLIRRLTGKRRDWPAALIAGILVIAYGCMTMWSAATIRAVIVLICSISMVYIRRRADLLCSVSTAAVLILSVSPYQLFNSGFQMSFLALGGIAFIAKPLSTLVGDGLAVMLAVQIGTAPLAAYIFHRFNPLSIFINIPVIALASILVPVCMLLLMMSIIGSAVWSFVVPGSAGIGTLSSGSAGLGTLGSGSAGLMLAGPDFKIPEIAVRMAEGLAEILIRINSLALGNGAFSNAVTAVNGGILVLFYLIAFLAASEWTRVMILRKDLKKIARALACVLMISLTVAAASYNTFADDEVVFVSVGQGDCTHIRAAGKDYLIDGGGSTDYNVGEKTLMPYLLANGARRVDLGMATHLHTDHYLGLVQLAAEYPVGAIGIPSDYRRSIESIEKRQSAGNAGRSAGHGNGQDSGRSAGQDSGRRAGQGSGSDRNSLGNGDVAGRGNSEGGAKSGERWKTEGGMDSFALPEKIEYMETGSRICISDDVYIEPIWPLRTSGGGIDIDDPNEHNMVYLVSYNGVKIMVTGDLLEEDELEMVSHYRGSDVLDCDVLKVAHHGSKSSSSEAFLDAVSPEIAVIQVGKNNLYGHPHQQTLERLEERGIKVYRTDQNGAVGVDIHGDEICIETNR